MLGKKESEEGSFRLLKAQVSAQTYVKMGFAVEERLHDGGVDWSGFPVWKTKPEKFRFHFEVLGRIDGGGKVIPEKIAQVQPFEAREAIAHSLLTGNRSLSRMPIFLPPPDYFFL